MVDKPQKWSDLGLEARCMILLTFGILLIAGVTAVILSGQFREMAKQTAESYQQAEIENAGASHRAAETMRQLNLAQQQANTARDNATITQQQMLIGERAWVSMGKISIDQHADNWETVNYTLTVNNLGKTPAIKMAVRGDYLVAGLDFPSQPSYRKLVAPQTVSQGDFGPSESGPVQGFVHAKDATESDEIKNLKKFYYVYGTLRYSDIFGIKHWSHYCYRIPAGFSPTLCDTYNDSDADYSDPYKQH